MIPQRTAADAWTASEAPEPHSHAGMMLRQAREAAGLSLDAVAAQLKLAPRQVQALEDGDYALLPGRTFVRGFARNYARLVRLDPDTVLDALPGGPGTEAPALQPTTGRMGELPSSASPRGGGLRWAIVLLVIAVVAGIAAYEYWYGGGRAARGAAPSTAKATAPRAAEADRAAGTDDANAPLGSSAEPFARDAGNTQDGSAAGSPARNAAGATTLAAPLATPLQDGTLAPLELAVRGPSWVEIKDSSGRTVLAQNLTAGQRQAVVGTPPFQVTIGNAPDVTLTYRGRPVDLAPHMRQNVARLTLE